MILWLLIACASRDLQAPPQPAQQTPPQQAPAEAQDPTAQCMAQCMRANMARAVGHPVIEADCKAACGAESVPGIEAELQLK